MRLSESTLKTLGPHCALFLRRTDSWGPHIGAGRQGGATGFLGRGSALDMAPRLSFLVDKVWHKAQANLGRQWLPCLVRKGNLLSGLGGMDPTVTVEVSPQGPLYSCHWHTISALGKPA